MNDSAVKIVVYTTSTHNDFIRTYCKECKPRRIKSKQGTLVVSDYDTFCSGCGESFRELAEREI